MSTAEIKMEIQQVLDKVPEDALPKILADLKQIQLSGYINRILIEDKELLKRLAQ